MSRTTRKFATDSNYREARGGRTYAARKSGTSVKALRAAGFVADGRATLRLTIRSSKAPWSPTLGPSTLHGGMLMSPSQTGRWRDEYHHLSRRSIKRAERNAWRRELSNAAI